MKRIIFFTIFSLFLSCGDATTNSSIGNMAIGDDTTKIADTTSIDSIKNDGITTDTTMNNVDSAKIDTIKTDTTIIDTTHLDTLGVDTLVVDVDVDTNAIDTTFQPTLIINQKIYTIELGSNFTPSTDIKFNAFDEKGKDATKQVLCIENINTKIAGDYNIILTFLDIADTVVLTVLPTPKVNLEITACMNTDCNLWFNITNREISNNYSGLEFRIYLPTSITQTGYVYWGVMPMLYFINGQIQKTPSFTKTFVAGDSYNYISIVLDDTFNFQSLSSLKFKIELAQLNGISTEKIAQGWSFREHNEDGMPYYRGIGAGTQEPNENNVLRETPDPWAGESILLPTEYITVYQNGELIYGYSPK